MPTWSHSRLQTYENCPQKFKFQYVDGIKPTKKSIHPFMGDMVHKVLEKLYEELRFGKVLPLEELLQDFDRLWIKERTKDLIIPDGRTEEDFQNLGRRCIENYYKKNCPFDQSSTIGIEEKVLIDLDGDIKVQGYIDRIGRRADGTLEIHDYKTSGKIPSQSGADADRQLALYHIGIQQRWPTEEAIELIWHYVALGEELRSRRTQEQLQKVKNGVVALIKQIEVDSDFEPRKSALCSYCEYQSICPLWKHLFEVKAMPETEKQADQIIQLVDRYGELRIMRSVIESQIIEIEKQLAEVPMGKTKSLFGKEWSVTLRKTNTVKIPATDAPTRRAVEKIIKEFGAWENLSALNTNLLKHQILEGILQKDISDLIEPLIKRETIIRYSVSIRSQKESGNSLD